MEDIEQWSTFNGMVMNGEKTKSMVICTYQKSTKIVSSDLHINYNNTVLENVESKRLLGVIVDNHLCWKDHINDLASNVSKLIALFRRIKMYLPLETRILFYKTFFQPRIDYYCTINLGTITTLLRNIQYTKTYKSLNNLTPDYQVICSNHCQQFPSDIQEALPIWTYDYQTIN